MSGLHEDESEHCEELLPSYEDLFLNESLYKEFHLLGDWSYVKRFYTGPKVQFDAYCIFCKREATFKQYAGSHGGSGYGSSTPKDETYLDSRIMHLDFQCQRKGSHHYHFVLQVDRQAIAKIGQSPSLATIATADLSRFDKVLTSNYVADLKRAIGLYAHGIGAGSFVYLRRIFEYLLLDIVKKARAEGDALFGFEGMRMKEKIDALKQHLPKEVIETAGTYSVLSAGIHKLTEQECLALFPVMRRSIEMILEGELAAKNKAQLRRDLKAAINEAETKISKKIQN